MARIKYVINERRLAYEGAVQIIAEGKGRRVPPKRVPVTPSEEVFEKEEASMSEPLKVEKVEEPPVAPHQTAAERAAAGLLRPDSIRK